MSTLLTTPQWVEWNNRVWAIYARLRELHDTPLLPHEQSVPYTAILGQLNLLGEERDGLQKTVETLTDLVGCAAEMLSEVFASNEEFFKERIGITDPLPSHEDFDLVLKFINHLQGEVKRLVVENEGHSRSLDILEGAIKTFQAEEKKWRDQNASLAEQLMNLRVQFDKNEVERLDRVKDVTELSVALGKEKSHSEEAWKQVRALQQILDAEREERRITAGGGSAFTPAGGGGASGGVGGASGGVGGASGSNGLSTIPGTAGGGGGALFDTTAPQTALPDVEAAPKKGKKK